MSYSDIAQDILNEVVYYFKDWFELLKDDLNDHLEEMEESGRARINEYEYKIIEQLTLILENASEEIENIAMEQDNPDLNKALQALFNAPNEQKELEARDELTDILIDIIQDYLEPTVEKIISYSGEEGLDYITQELIDINYWEIALTCLAKAIDELDFKQAREEQEISGEYGR